MEHTYEIINWSLGDAIPVGLSDGGFFPLRNTEKKRCKEVIQAGKGVLTNKRTDVFAPVLEKKHADQLEETCRGHFAELPTANDAFYLITQN